jgi:multiple sugar transport system permease protein
MENKPIKHKPLTRKYAKWGYIFVIPFVVAYIIFHLYPLFLTIILAFTDQQGIGFKNYHFLPSVGRQWYENFVRVCTAKMFKKAVSNTFFFWICEVIPEWIIAFWLAAVINDRRMRLKGKMIFKAAYFMPKILSGYIVGFFLISYFSNMFGKAEEFVLIASAIDGFGFEPEMFEFLWTPQFFIIVINFFMHFGVIVVYALAGMSTVPTEVFEAAEVDGATRFQTFFRITIPCMRPVLFYISVITILDGIGMFDVPYIFGYDLHNTNTTIMTYIHTIAFFGSYKYAVASAASVILLIIIGGISILAAWVLRDKDEEKLKRMRKHERREERRLKRASSALKA